MPSKEAVYVDLRPPPRPPKTPADHTVTLPLEQLWDQFPPTKRQELLVQLTRMLSQQVAPSSNKEEPDE